MKNPDNALQLIPDIFYDTLAYLLPASFLLAGVLIVSAPIRAAVLTAYFAISEPFDKFVVITIGAGVLYIMGQLVTHFSYETIQRPLRAFASWRKDKRFPRSDIDWTGDYTFVRHKDAALGLEVTKRYARIIMARNNALVSLMLTIISVVSNQTIGAIVCGTLFLLFLHEAYGRRVFFYLYLLKVARELREIESVTKSK